MDGWALGYTIGTVVVLVVVALVVPILLLAHRIGKQAAAIDGHLQQAVTNTAALAGLNTTIDHAVTIIDGLRRGREKLEADVDETLWWWAVALGFVVVLAVAGLLTILVLEVRTIGRNVTRVKGSLQAAAANTDDTVLIGQTAEGVEAVLAEGLKHHLFLGRVLEKVRM